MSDLVIKEGYKLQNSEKIKNIEGKDKDGSYIDVGTNWPVLYIMYNKKKRTVYVGQSVNVFKRMKQHLKEDEFLENELEDIWITYSKIGNLSMTINLENQLIRLLAAEKSNKILNRNGSNYHEYYGKAENDKDLNEIWNMLKSSGIVKQDLKEIQNQELYKLSPFISLTNNQNSIITNIVDKIISEKNMNIETQNIIINGLPGSGKTIMALYLARELKSKFDEKGKNLKIAIVTPINQFNYTLKKVVDNIYIFKDIKIYSPVEAVKAYLKRQDSERNSEKKFDILIIDEAHRLKFCVSNQTIKVYKTICQKLKLVKGENVKNINQLQWLLEISKTSIILYDEFQGIRPVDLKKKDLEEITGIKIDNIEKENYFILNEPVRIKVNNYIEYIEEMLQIENGKDKIENLNLKDYELCMTEDLKDLVSILKKKENARLVAGYAWEWKTQEKNKEQKLNHNYDKYYDFEEYLSDDGEYTREKIDKREPDFKKKWNKSNASGWCESEAAKKLDEIGCVHTIQGYDVDYVGVIFGREIEYRDGKIIVNRQEYKDRGGFNSNITDEELVGYIKNIYRILMTRGVKGTYIYVFDKELREYIKKNFKKIKIIERDLTNGKNNRTNKGI